MAEVRKKILEDKYNNNKVKKNEIQVKKDKINSNKKNDNKKEKNFSKKSLYVRFRIFCHGVKTEFDKVHWTSKNKMIKYSIAVIVFIILCSLFFYLIDVIFALIQSLFS